jgi:hypothetical protein
VVIDFGGLSMNLMDSIYRLELHWEKAIYDKEGQCELINTYFSGPVLSLAQKINSNEYIKLDFFNQYFPTILNVYVVKLLWGEVIYKNNIVLLKDVVITDTDINKAPKLNDNDYIIMDTSDHTLEKHGFNLVYTSFVINNEGTPYKFEEK